MPKGIDQELWERIRGATIEGYLGTQCKVLKDFTRACVYTRDYRDLDDLRRVLTVLRGLGVGGWADYKRDCDTARGLYGRGALYWHSPPGTVAIDVPLGRSAGRWTARPPPSPRPRRPPKPAGIIRAVRAAARSAGPGTVRAAGTGPWEVFILSGSRPITSPFSDIRRHSAAAGRHAAVGAEPGLAVFGFRAVGRGRKPIGPGPVGITACPCPYHHSAPHGPPAGHTRMPASPGQRENHGVLRRRAVAWGRRVRRIHRRGPLRTDLHERSHVYRLLDPYRSRDPCGDCRRLRGRPAFGKRRCVFFSLRAGGARSGVRGHRQ